MPCAPASEKIGEHGSLVSPFEDMDTSSYITFANPISGLNAGYIRSVFATMLGDWFTPRKPSSARGIPFDATGQSYDRHGTFPVETRPFPYPWTTGAVSGFMPMMDQFSMSYSYARPGYGPGYGGTATPSGLNQITYPMLAKVSG
jgi:hypothetical protein